MDKLKAFIRKPYFKYIIVIAVFIILIVFLDRNSLLRQVRLSRTIREKEAEEQFYTTRINEERQLIEGLSSDTATLERIARERYLMKRDNEVIYIIKTRPELDRNGFGNQQ